jgi:hypothetical protein
MVANAPLFVQLPPPLEPELLLVPPQEALMAPLQEPLMVPPFCDGATNGSGRGGVVKKVLEKHDVRSRRC